MLPTYVKRLNGQSGPDHVFMPDNNVRLDSRGIRRHGDTGTPAKTINTSVTAIAQNVRPMYVNKIQGDDYSIELPNGISI